MAALTFADLQKPLPGGSIPRWTVLVSKIKNKEPFSLDGSGSEVVLNYLDENIQNLFESGSITKIQSQYRGKNLFKTAKGGKQLNLGKLFKSPDFGGGKGSGAGAAETERNESAQCLYASLACYVFKKQIPLDAPITKQQFKDAMKYCDVSEKFEKMLDLPKDWHESSILGANYLHKKYALKGKYEYHRGSSLVDTIENTFKRLNSNEKAFGNLNKWSPADMYMFTQAGKDAVKNELVKVKTLQQLNTLMVKYYKSHDIIGVSLKKISGTVKATENNVGDTDKVEVEYLGEQVVATNKNSILDSMDVYLEHSNGRIQFRSFGSGSLTSWQGEGKGTYANQGKVSLGPTNYILGIHGVDKLPESRDSARLAKNPDTRYYKDFYDAAKRVKTKNLPDTQEEFVKLWESANEQWRYSKYLGVLLVDRMLSLSKEKRNEVITDLYLYSASKASFAGPFLKLE